MPSIQFGAMTRVAKFDFHGKYAKDDPEEPTRHSLESRRAYAENYVQDRPAREQADWFEFSWYDMLTPEDIQNKTQLYSFATHSGGKPVDPDVYIVTDEEAAAKRQLDAIQEQIDTVGASKVDPNLLRPIAFHNLPTGKRSGVFDPKAAISRLNAANPKILNEFMRFSFSNLPAPHDVQPYGREKAV